MHNNRPDVSHQPVESTEAHSVESCQRAKPRAVLTCEKAIAIFQRKLPLAKAGSAKPCASAIAREYGVSEKAIRDIWTGRTWFEETASLEPTRPARAPAPPGRPKGRKDSVPRRRRRPSAGPLPPSDDGEGSAGLAESAASDY